MVDIYELAKKFASVVEDTGEEPYYPTAEAEVAASPPQNEPRADPAVGSPGWIAGEMQRYRKWERKMNDPKTSPAERESIRKELNRWYGVIQNARKAFEKRNDVLAKSWSWNAVLGPLYQAKFEEVARELFLRVGIPVVGATAHWWGAKYWTKTQIPISVLFTIQVSDPAYLETAKRHADVVKAHMDPMLTNAAKGAAAMVMEKVVGYAPPESNLVTVTSRFDIVYPEWKRREQEQQKQQEQTPQKPQRGTLI